MIDLNEVEVTPRDHLSVPVAHAAGAPKREAVETVWFAPQKPVRVVLCSLNIGDYDAGDSGFRQAPFVQFSAKAFTLVRRAAD